MNTVGPTKAMRRVLERDGYSAAALARAIDAGLVNPDPGAAWLTPRGHAALAAPRMTKAEYDVLAALAVGNVLWATRHSAVITRCKRHEWVHDATVSLPMGLTPAGRTALNNVRAAIGSPEYKENP